jgi:UDP-glucose 4-epimerase
VTGGAGFIGSHLCDALVARGDTVRVLDDLSTGRRRNLRQAARNDQGRALSDARGSGFGLTNRPFVAVRRSIR